MNLEEFKALQRERQNSNMSICEFIAAKGIPGHRYYYWARKWNEQVHLESGNSFVQIMPNPNVRMLSVEYPNGVRIHFNDMPTIRLLVHLVNLKYWYALPVVTGTFCTQGSQISEKVTMVCMGLCKQSCRAIPLIDCWMSFLESRSNIYTNWTNFCLRTGDLKTYR